MRLKTAAFATAALLTLAVLPAAAGGKHRGMNPISHMMQELDLTDAQTSQVNAITEKYTGGAMGDPKDAMHQARAALHRAIHDVTVSERAVRDAAEVVAKLEAQRAVEHHRMAIEISAVLTPDQRTRLAELFANMQERHAAPPGAHGGF